MCKADSEFAIVIVNTDKHHGSTAIGSKALKQNGQCVVNYYQRCVCKIAAFGSNKERNPRIRNDFKVRNKSKPKKNVSYKNGEKARKNSEVERNNDVKSTSTQNCGEILQQFDKLRKKDIESIFKFPSEDVCAYLSIREIDQAETSEIENASTCRTGLLNASQCKLVNAYLGRPRQTPPRLCSARKTARNICWFAKRYRSSIEDMAGLQCDTGICQESVVHLGVFDLTLGQVMPDDDWRMFSNESALVRAIGDVMQENYSNHFRYCLRNCLSISE